MKRVELTVKDIIKATSKEKEERMSLQIVSKDVFYPAFDNSSGSSGCLSCVASTEKAMWLCLFSFVLLDRARGAQVHS
jgi:hypothetical protein